LRLLRLRQSRRGHYRDNPGGKRHAEIHHCGGPFRKIVPNPVRTVNKHKQPGQLLFDLGQQTKTRCHLLDKT
jgi:hypothetical protein